MLLENLDPRMITFGEDSVQYFDKTCQICKVDFTPNEKITKLGCEHIFHIHCSEPLKKCPFDQKEIGCKKITFLKEQNLLLPNSFICYLNHNKRKFVDLLSKLSLLIPVEIGKKIEAILSHLTEDQDMWKFLVQHQKAIQEVLLLLLQRRIYNFRGDPIVITEGQCLFVFLQDLIDLLDPHVERCTYENRLERIWQKYPFELTLLLGPIVYFQGLELRLNLKLFVKKIEVYFYLNFLAHRIITHDFYPRIEAKTSHDLSLRYCELYREKSTFGRYKMIWNMNFFKKTHLYTFCQNPTTDKGIRSKIRHVWSVKALLVAVVAFFFFRRLFG